MDVQIIKMPLDYGAGTRGCRRGPDKLLEHGLADILKSACGEVRISECRAAEYDESNPGSEKAKFLSEIVETNKRLAGMVEKAIMASSFPLILGGDHSLLLGSVAGAAVAASKKRRTLGILYVDAHGDFNTVDTSPTGNIHGMPLAASAGIGIKELTNIHREGKKVEPTNICIIGARDLDEGEIELLRKNNVVVFTATMVKEFGIAEVTRRCLAYLRKRCEMIHLSFDVDSVDPQFAPGTGIHLPGGLTYSEAVSLIEILKKSGKITSADFVEYNPDYDEDYKTNKMCLDLIACLLGE